METIHYTTKPFDFDALTLDHPSGLQGGSYFTKISHLGNNLYIQTGQCETKNGINKTSKKAYCDLMFPTTDETTVKWFEELEKKSIDYIYEKRSTWFHNELERDEIETNFVSPLRLYKSGKYYLIRVYLASDSLANNLFKCYNDASHPVPYDVLQKDNVKVIPLLEIQGIKFSSRNFSLDIGLKQIMVLENPDFLQKCFIQKDLGKNTSNIPLVEEAVIPPGPLSVPTPEPLVEEPVVPAVVPPEPLVEKPVASQVVPPEPLVEPVAETKSEPTGTTLEEHSINYDSLAKEEELVTLKNPEEVYYDIWYEARRRAKSARDEAIKAYLEAKKIKATYMLDEYSDSEDEFDEFVADE